VGALGSVVPATRLLVETVSASAADSTSVVEVVGDGRAGDGSRSRSELMVKVCGRE